MRFVSYAKPAEKALGAMPRADGEAMHAKLMAFAETGSGDVKKLKGSHYFCLRHGDYRAVILIQPDSIQVHAINHRREAYRRK